MATNSPRENRPAQRHMRFWPTDQPTELALPVSTLWENLAESAARYPDKTAIAFLGSQLSYRQLLNQAEVLAGWLHSVGVRHGDRVALFMQNCPQWVIAFHAITRLGAVVLPVNPMNRAAELQYLLEDAEVRAVICSAEVAAHVATAQTALDITPATMPVVVTAYVDALPDVSEREPTIPAAMLSLLLAEHPLPAGFVPWRQALSTTLIPPAYSVKPDDLAMLPYTSGTTGKAKGCLHTHRTLMPNIIGIGQWGHTTAESIWLGVAPMFHITGVMGSMLSPLFGGCTVVMMPRWDRELATTLIARHQVTVWILIPTMLIDLLGDPNLDRSKLSSLKFLYGGGAPMPSAVADQLQARLGMVFNEGYGLTETAAPTHGNPVGRVKRQCLGIPVYGTDARIIDPQTGLEVPSGEVGEIVVRGPQLFLGYWRQPEATAAAFIEIDGQRFFRTGDLGHVDEEGYFFLTDRLKRMINSSGYKIWPSEVELMLFKHPAVHEACVISTRDAYRGEMVKAVIVLAIGATATAEDIIAWARTQISAYKVPRVIEFVAALPKNASGKVMWRTLQEAEDQRSQSH